MKAGTAVLWDEYKGVVFRVIEPHVETREVEIEDDEGGVYYDLEECTDGRWDVHMVGDDRVFTVDEDELREYDEDVCSCGQVGCGWA